MSSNVFLKIKFEKAGVIQGEGNFSGFTGAIVCNSLNWEMTGKDVPIGEDRKLTKRDTSVGMMTIEKHFDQASTRLMMAMKNGDLIKTAHISVTTRLRAQDRKNELREIIGIEISDAYLEDVDLSLAEDKLSAVITETLKIKFSQIKFVYHPRHVDGSISSVQRIFEWRTSDHVVLGDD